MKLVRWTYNNLHIPMMSDSQGELWCTSRQLCGALGLEPKALRELKRRNIEEFEFLSATENGAKEFLKENKTEFGIRRVRQDITLWSEDDMVTVAILATAIHEVFGLESMVCRRFYQNRGYCIQYVFPVERAA